MIAGSKLRDMLKPCHALYAAYMACLNLPFQIFKKARYLITHIEQMLHKLPDQRGTLCTVEMSSSFDVNMPRNAGLFALHSLAAV